MFVGTTVRGIRSPIIKENDDLESIVIDSLLKAKEEENFEFEDRDILAITEAVVGISQSNYATIDNIKDDINNKMHSDHIGIVYPILSRNRFAVLLSAIARSAKKLTILLSFPSDEVGNDILYSNDLIVNRFNLSSVITEFDYNKFFGHYKHLFTGVNMVDFYRDLCLKENCEVEFVFSNNPETIINYTKDIIVANVHDRFETKKKLLPYTNSILLLSDIMNNPVNGSGYNSEYGLLGSNRSTEEKVKLFPKDCERFVKSIQTKLREITGKNIEVMVYGDGAFKDPVGKIWELADPVVSPGFTDGLEGSPNEIKLKYFSENKYKDLRGEELNNAIKEEIKYKENDLKGTMSAQGTTPRKYTDLIGTLADLTSGSGDKGTPFVYIKGYFKNYSN